MSDPDRAGDKIVRTYAVLCGLTPLVPIPFVDDMVKGYFRRRLVRALAAARGQTLSRSDVSALADAPLGCLTGCLGAAFIYPLKMLFRKIFYFLEWKRAVDTASETYHFGSLVDYTLQSRWYPPAGTRTPARIRAGIDAVLESRSTGPIEMAIGATFRHSKDALGAAARTLWTALRGLGRRAPEEQVERALESTDLGRQGAQIADDLGRALDGVPPSYMAGLCRQLTEELAREPVAPPPAS